VEGEERQGRGRRDGRVTTLFGQDRETSRRQFRNLGAYPLESAEARLETPREEQAATLLVVAKEMDWS